MRRFEMTRTVSATEARVHFGELMRAVVERGDTAVVERSGAPKVVVLSVQEYERLLGGQSKIPEWRRLLDEAHELIRQERQGRPLPDAAEVINQGREERDAELREALLRR
jgi:prevent-host-death family protein